MMAADTSRMKPEIDRVRKRVRGRDTSSDRAQVDLDDSAYDEAERRRGAWQLGFRHQEDEHAQHVEGEFGLNI
jgi:hypothetical protein